MRNCVGIVLMACGVMTASGCATYRAYPGPRRPTAQIAVVMVSVDGLHVDGDETASNVNKVELAPGAHELQWSYRYPNGYVEAMVLDFEALAGQRYRLGQRFFAQPHPDGPIGAIVEFTVETALIPIKVFVPREVPEGPPEGEYYSWVVATRSGRVVGGLAPDVPPVHPPITYVPANQPDP